MEYPDYFDFYTRALLAGMAGGLCVYDSRHQAELALAHWLEWLPELPESVYLGACEFLDAIRADRRATKPAPMPLCPG